MNKDLDSSGIDDFMRNIESRGPAASPLKLIRKDSPEESIRKSQTTVFQDKDEKNTLKRPQSSVAKKTTTLSTAAKKSAAFRPIEDEGDISDRCYRFEKENFELKTKGNVLEREVDK